MSGRALAATKYALPILGLVLYQKRWELLARALGLPPARHKVTMEHGLHIPMADGVKLLATHHRPVEPGHYPTVLIRSPYGCGREAGWFGIFYEGFTRMVAARGYHVIIQTVRGRCGSEGEFEICVHEAADGLATLTWLKEQPWFNGKLGLWGPSYLGYTVWSLATNAPEDVQAFVPSFSSTQFYRPLFQEGIFALDAIYQAIRLLRYDNPQSRGKITPADLIQQNLPQQRQQAKAAFNHLPLNEFDRVVSGQTIPAMQDWLTSFVEDNHYWQRVDYSEQVAQITAPAQLISGWYDIFLPGLLTDYAALKAAGTKPHLTIGPWSHINLGVVIESLQAGFNWFEAYLKDQPERLPEYPVKLYMMGAKKWRNYPDWPLPTTEQSLYLHTDGRLADQKPASFAKPTAYHYDPADPTPSVGGALFSFEAGAHDNRRLEARPDVKCFTTKHLTAALEIIGQVRLELYVRSSLPYTDFFGRLCDVQPGGRSVNICDGIFRVLPGKGEKQPDDTLRLLIELSPVAYQFKPGHRLRLQVSSGAHPRWNRNLGTNEPIDTATRLLAADQLIYHDETHPSALFLPIMGDGR